LVAETIDRSNPNLIGFKKYGVAQVLSIAVYILCFFAIFKIFPKS